MSVKIQLQFEFRPSFPIGIDKITNSLLNHVDVSQVRRNKFPNDWFIFSHSWVLNWFMSWMVIKLGFKENLELMRQKINTEWLTIGP